MQKNTTELFETISICTKIKVNKPSHFYIQNYPVTTNINFDPWHKILQNFFIVVENIVAEFCPPYTKFILGLKSCYHSIIIIG